MKIFEDKNVKIVRSENYNYDFSKKTGFFARWGKTKEDDPVFGFPEILDLEISSGGDCLGNCPFCYKCNGGNQETYNMPFEAFKTVFDKMPKTLTQIAFGIMNIKTNPDFFKMMEYSKKNGVIPNYTCHGLDTTPEIAKKTSELCGAVAVSFNNKEKTFESVRMFSDAGMDQVNIHFMLSEETYKKAFEIIDDVVKREIPVRAIVFLQYKSKGRGLDKFNPISSVEKYKKLYEYVDKQKVGIGFDSCSAPLYFKAIENKKSERQLSEIGEPCESACFSSYINCHGDFYPCSFSEGEGTWKTGISVLEAENFLKDVWFNDKVNEWRNALIKSSHSCDCKFNKMCRNCPIYDITACKRKV